MICLSKNLKDPYINAFARGSNFKIYDNEFPDEGTLIFRSMAKRDLIKKCWETGRDFYYMDSGYVGNYVSKHNPTGAKWYHRIVKNNLQHSEIIERPDDRWKRLDFALQPVKTGRHILLVTPSEKPCKFYNIDLIKWKTRTIAEIKRYTDRPIIVRDKGTRQERLDKTIFEALFNCHAVVTYQSIAAVESILYGIPAFTMAPTAADPVANKDLSKIENPNFPDSDTRNKWAHHLAYGQFHVRELKNGKAYRMLMNEDS